MILDKKEFFTPRIPYETMVWISWVTRNEKNCQIFRDNLDRAIQELDK